MKTVSRRKQKSRLGRESTKRNSVRSISQSLPAQTVIGSSDTSIKSPPIITGRNRGGRNKKGAVVIDEPIVSQAMGTARHGTVAQRTLKIATAMETCRCRHRNWKTSQNTVRTRMARHSNGELVMTRITKRMTPEEFRAALGRHIAELRRLHGSDQQTFARKLHWSQSGLSRVETGHSDITIYRLQEIAVALGTTVGNLL